MKTGISINTEEVLLRRREKELPRWPDARRLCESHNFTLSTVKSTGQLMLLQTAILSGLANHKLTARCCRCLCSLGRAMTPKGRFSQSAVPPRGGGRTGAHPGKSMCEAHVSLSDRTGGVCPPPALFPAGLVTALRGASGTAST